MRPLLATLGILTTLTGGAIAQEPGRHEERVATVLHLVDVTVRDGRGRAISGLGASDFRAWVGGEERRIVACDAGRLPRDAQTGAVPTGGAWSVVLLDADRISIRYRPVALDAVRALVADAARDGTRVAIALLRDGNLELLHPFAPAAELDLSILDRPELLLATSTELETRVGDLLQTLDGCPRQDPVRMLACVRGVSSEFLAASRGETERGLVAMRDLVAALAPLPGRKALVWLSDGLMTRPGEVVLDALAAISPDAWDRLFNQLQDPPSDALEALLDEAVAARVSILALRTSRGLESGRAGELSAAWRSATRVAEESLRTAAESTGGRAVLVPLQGRALEGLLGELDAVYTLAVEAKETDRPGVELDVRLARGKGRVRAHRTLAARPPRSLAGTLATRGGGPAGEPVEIVLALERGSVDPGSRVALYARVERAEGGVLGEDYAIVEFPRDAAQGEPLVFPFRFVLDPGPYVGRITAAVLAGDGRETFELPFTVGSGAAARR